MAAMTFTRTTKTALTIVLFVIAASMVWVADLVENTAPLFAGWVPLLIVPWVLTRPEERAVPPVEDDSTPNGAATARDEGPEPEA
jgi:hypothetical protein